MKNDDDKTPENLILCLIGQTQAVGAVFLLLYFTEFPRSKNFSFT